MILSDMRPSIARVAGAVLLSLFAALAATAPASAAIDIQRVVSPLGIEAWLVSEFSLPMMTMSYSFDGGSIQDPADKPGVANMLSDILDEGAGDLDSQAYQSALADSSIRISFNSDRDSFSGSFRALDANRAEAVELLKLALTKPRFDAEPMERIRTQILNGIRSAANNPQSIAGSAWTKAAFPDHLYGRPGNGTAESVKTITAADLRAYMKRVLARDNLKISVVGAIDAPALGKLLDEVFGGLPAKADLVSIPVTRPVVGARINVDMKLAQTIIRFGGEGLLRTDPDFMAASVAGYILGGGAFSSRLYTELREKRGFVYSVSVGLAPLDHAGLFSGSTATRPDRADEALAIVESEIKRFAEEGPTNEEVANAKSYLIGSYALRFDSSGSIASQLLGIQMDDLGIDYVNRRNSLIGAVTTADVKRAAKRVFGGGLITVKVGQAG